MNYEEFMQRYSAPNTGGQTGQGGQADSGYQAFMQRYGVNPSAGTGSKNTSGPLQITKGGGGQTAAPAVQDTAPAVQSPLEQLFGPRLDPQQQQTMRQAIAATKPAAAPAQTGISAELLLPYRQIGERGAAARQEQQEESPLLKLFAAPARHQGRQTHTVEDLIPTPAVSATWRANAGMDAQQAPAWQQEAQQQRQSAAQGAPTRQMNAGMGTSAVPRQQESESQRRRREARQRAVQINKEALENGAPTLEDKSTLVQLRLQQQQAAYAAQGQEARMEQNPAGGRYAPGNTLLGTVQRSEEGLREQELKNEAVQTLAAMTGPEEYLAKEKLTEMEKQAALLLLNQYREENRDKLDHYDTLPQEQRDEADQWLALEHKLGSFTSTMDRLAKGARSMQYNLVGTPDVIGKTAQQAAKDTAADWHDPEWSALADQLVQIDRQMMIREELGGAEDQKLQELKAQRAAIRQQMDAVAQKTPLDLDTYGARTLLLGQKMNRQAQTGLSPEEKTLYSVGYSVADNLAVMPLNFIPGVGQAAALGVQGAKAGAQEMLELAQRGVGAEEAFARGAIAGGIEAGTEKIGMDNLVDIVGKGGKKALNSLLKKQLAELAAKGGESAGASVAAALLSNATAEGMEEAVGYIANYAADQLFGDPESEFSLEEFLASMGQGAAAGLILGGGGMAVNAALGHSANVQNRRNGENAALQPNAKPVAPTAEAEMPVAAEMYRVLAGLDDSAASRAQGALMALDVELAQNLAQQEQLKMRVQMLVPDPTKITTVQQTWGQLSQLMDQESEIRLQKEVFQRQSEIGSEAVAAVRDPLDAAKRAAWQDPVIQLIAGEHYEPGVTIRLGVKADEAAFAQVDRAARALGRPVVVESLPQGHNGYYKDGTIHISAQSQNPMMNVFTHELTHHLETGGEYAALADYVKSSEIMRTFLKDNDMTMEEYRGFLRDSYAQMGVQLDERAADAEIVANFCEKFLFKDEAGVRQLCGEKPRLGRRILDFIRQMLSKLRGGEGAELRQAEQLFVKALNGAQTENADAGRQLSVQENYTQANNGGADAVSYEALTALPDMQLTQISTALPEGMSIGDVARLGVENSRLPGMKNGRVTNRYTGQEIQITADGLRHGMTRKTRLQKNGPYAIQAGEILKNAIKVNELSSRGNEVRTDIYLGGAIDESGIVHGVRFLVKLYENGNQAADLGDMEIYNGSLYAHTGTKIGTAALRAPEISNQVAAPTVPTLTIADLLGTVKGKMDTFLSENVKENIGTAQGKNGEFGDSQLYSVTPSLTPQAWKQGQRTAPASMEKGTVAPKVPEVSGQAATPTVPASTIPGIQEKVKPGEIDLGGARRWLEQRNEARAHADENYMSMSDMEAGRIRVNSPEQALRPLRQAVQANVEGEYSERMPELPREVVADLRPGKGLHWKDFDRVMDTVAPKGSTARAFLDEHLIKPFLAAKKAYAMDTVNNKRKFSRQMEALGVKPGSEAAWYLGWYREGLRPVAGADGLLMEEAAPYTLENLKADRPRDWQNIVKAAELYGQWSDDLYEVENRSLEVVYPNAEQEIQEQIDKLDAMARGMGLKLEEAQAELRRIDPVDELEYAAAWDKYERTRKSKAQYENRAAQLQEQLDSGEALRRKRLQYRQNYVPHRYETKRGFRALKNILTNVDQNIDPDLVGVSDNTRPKSRWAGWMQHRSKEAFLGMDPVSAFLEYMGEVEYKAHLDPLMAQARELTAQLRTQTKGTRNANALIEWLNDWTNDLAGKTGYWDRPVQKEHGRKAMAVLQWLNSRAKANAVMGNLSSALSQVYNLPNSVGMLKNPADMAKGAALYGKLLSGDAETRTLIEQSGFLTERYALQNLDSELRRLGMDEIESPETLWRWISQKPEHMAAFMLEAGDRAVAEYTWLSAYEQAVRKGTTDPFSYADELTRKSVGGRGVGEMPLVLRNKVINLIAPFQVEVTNAFNMMVDKVKKKDLIGLFLTFLMTYALNGFRKEYLDGRETGFDPIGAVLDTWEQSGEDEDATMGSRLTATGFRLGGEALSNMPFGDMVASVALGADSQTAKNLFGESDPTRFGTGNIGLSALVDPVIQLGSAAVNHKDISEVDLKNPIFQLFPSYGGKQLERGVQAAQDMGFLPTGPFGLPVGTERNEAPGSYNNQGNLRFPIDTSNGLNVLAGLTWGSYATNEGKKYLKNGGKPKNASYTDAYKEGYSTSILEQLFPGSTKGAGKVTYEQMTGGAEGAAEVDNWLTELMRYQGNKNVLPSNSTTSVTVDGETIKLQGSQALEFAQTKQETSYNILEALIPTANRYDQGVQEKYAVRAQDYAHAAAKEEVLGVEPKEGSWVEKLQTYSGVEGAELNDKLLNALLGSSIVAEATPDYYPNGSTIEGSRKRKAMAALREAGFDTRTALQMWEVFN